VGCHRSLGLECIRGQCTPSRRIGDVGCRPGDPDCNVCIPNVRQQFDALFSSGTWRDEAWHFSWNRHYSPSGITPDEAYDEGGLDDFVGIPEYHAQGFVHTNSSRWPFAMTHSDDKDGSLAVIGVDSSGRLDLEAMHGTANTTHPSAAFTLGKYVGFTDGSSRLRLVDLSRPLESQNIIFDLPAEVLPPPPPPDPFAIPCDGEQAAWGLCQPPPPPPSPRKVGTAGGGIAAARLKSGAHLIVGAEGSSRGGTHFVLAEGNVEQPSSIRYVGYTSYDGPPAYIASENLSVVTECMTGDIYTVHIAGTDNVDVVFDTDGEGWYRLSKLEWDGQNDVPVLRHQVTRVFDQEDDDCWTRGAASLYSNPDTRMLDAYCHGRDVDTGGADSAFLFRSLKRSGTAAPAQCATEPLCSELCGEAPLPVCRF
jgi:hypothetical protein